jgi:phage shock protein A
MAVTAENLLAEKVAELTAELKQARSMIAKLRAERDAIDLKRYQFEQELMEHKQLMQVAKKLDDVLDEIRSIKGWDDYR